MADLTFTPIANFNETIRAVAKALESDYMVTGEATHAALTDLDEVAIAYPLHEGALILIFRLHHAAEYIRLSKLQEAAKTESEEDEIMRQIFALGCDPDENTMEPDEMKKADNGDGTFTLRASVSLI